MRRLRAFFILGLVLVATPCALAQSATELVPSSGARGTRALVAGSGLAAPGIAIVFPRSGGGDVVAEVLGRTTDAIDIRVPLDATTGTVRITNGSSTIGSFAFTLAPDPAFAEVRTVVASGAGREPLKAPAALVVLPDGTVAIADTMHHQIAIATPAGTVNPWIGSGRGGFTDGAAATAELRNPQGLAFDAARNILYIADTGNHAIRRVANGLVSTLAGSGRRGDADGTGAQA